MVISSIKINDSEVSRLLKIEESHFCDFKAIEILPSKLTNTIAAFANAEGGDIYIGIDEDSTTHIMSWRGFPSIEAANSHIQTFEKIFPLGTDYACEFLENDGSPGYVLKLEIYKSREIKKASNKKIYLRRGAQNLTIELPEAIQNLKRDKGLTSFETEPVNCESENITNSENIIKFMLEIVPTSEPEFWLKKQQMLINGKPTVAGIVLFADEPQAILPKRCGIKVYRYKSSEREGTRESLDFNPISVEGCAYQQIHEAVKTTAKIIQSVKIMGPEGLKPAQYPIDAIHEIITNAVIHRDYSFADDVHIRIFDNRVEVLSPGKLPGHITPKNILDERFARNSVIVRIINKFPNPPNKDVGEGLNTAFQAMRKMKLKDPEIEQSEGNVIVTLKHEPLASPEEIILKYLDTHDEIANKQGREICFIGSENKMKRILQKMVTMSLIEKIPERSYNLSAYCLPNKNKA